MKFLCYAKPKLLITNSYSLPRPILKFKIANDTVIKILPILSKILFTQYKTHVHFFNKVIIKK